MSGGYFKSPFSNGFFWKGFKEPIKGLELRRFESKRVSVAKFDCSKGFWLLLAPISFELFRDC